MSYRKFTKDFGIVGITNIILSAKGFLVLPLITKILGAEVYGVWSQIIVTLALISPLATLGLPYTLVRFLSSEKDKEKIKDSVYSVLFLILIFSAVISAGLIIFSASFAKILGTEKNIVLILAVAIIFECLNLVFLNVFRFLQLILSYSIFIILQTIGEILFLLLAIFLNYGLFGAVVSVLLIRIISFLVMTVFVVKRIGIHFPKFKKTKEYLFFGVPTVFSQFSLIIIESFNRYLISFFLGPLFVGYFSSANMIGSIGSLFITSLNFVLPPFISKHFDQENNIQVRTYLEYSLKIMFIILIPATAGLSILSAPLLRIFTTPEISERSWFIVPFTAISMLLFGVCIIYEQIIALLKKTKISGAIWSIGAVLNIALNLLFIPKIGIIGAGMASLLTFTFVLIAMVIVSLKNFEISVDRKLLLKSSFSAFFMSYVVLRFNPSGVIEIIMAVIIGGMLYGAILFLLRGIAKKEIDFVKSLFTFIR